MIKTLWIDDFPYHYPDDTSFEDVAFEEGIEIINAVCVDDGINMLLNKSNNFEAVILDINCFRHHPEEGALHSSALAYAINQFYKYDIRLPYFIYSGMDEDGLNVVENVVGKNPNPWDNRLLYHKSQGYEDLFKAIKTTVEAWPDHKLKMRYLDAFGIVADGKLIDLLKEFESDPTGRNINVIKNIRPLFEELAIYLNKKGLVSIDDALEIQCKNRSSNIIKDCSAYIDLEDYRRKFVPTHIKRLFHLVSQCANESAHFYGKTDVKEEEVDNKITNMLESGKTPYLARIMVFGFLEILTWVKSLPIDDPVWMNSWKKHFNDLKDRKIRENKNNEFKNKRP